MSRRSMTPVPTTLRRARSPPGLRTPAHGLRLPPKAVAEAPLPGGVRLVSEAPPQWRGGRCNTGRLRSTTPRRPPYPAESAWSRGAPLSEGTTHLPRSPSSRGVRSPLITILRRASSPSGNSNNNTYRLLPLPIARRGGCDRLNGPQGSPQQAVERSPRGTAWNATSAASVTTERGFHSLNDSARQGSRKALRVGSRRFSKQGSKVCIALQRILARLRADTTAWQS